MHNPTLQVPEGIEINGRIEPDYETILSQEALEFLALLQRSFKSRRKTILDRRRTIQRRLNEGIYPRFLPETQAIREREWQIAKSPKILENRRVEITGPTDRKMIINAMNSGANIFMADFEDANSPTWQNMVEGQINLRDAVRQTISFVGQDGREYKLNEKTAVLLVRPRGWHLDEKHVLVDGEPISGSIFDFGLYLFHNHQQLKKNGVGPYYYLAKLENHLEARLWNEIFVMAQDRLGIPRGTIRATVLIETILAAFEMDEILYELRDHVSGLNAGRWDYIFSIIKKFRRPGLVLPDRHQITMTVPFMRAYTELLVHTCHKRGAHAIGGMAAYIPSRKDPEINELALNKVREDKIRESQDGFDGTWVAHPDLVPVARDVFDATLGDRPNQKNRLREDVSVGEEDLFNFEIPGGTVTEAGIRNNINVALQYLASWLAGRGAVAIHNLMEDTATAEISRSQLWQWLHQDGARLDDGRLITRNLYQQCHDEELSRIRDSISPDDYQAYQFDLASQLLDNLVLVDDFVEFLTIPGYQYLD